MTNIQWIILGSLWGFALISTYLLGAIGEKKFPKEHKDKLGKNGIIAITLFTIFVGIPGSIGVFMVFISKYPIPTKIGIIGIYMIVYYIVVFAVGLQIKKRTGKFFG